MIVSWKWLKEYVKLDMSQDELELRLTLSGLNHEGTETVVDDDLAIDLEVTSNRPDCLGHIGVAREIAVLWDSELRIPKATPAESGGAVSDITKVTIDCPELCPRYSARVIRGIKVGESPAWLTCHLDAIGVGAVNNVVDISNFVLMECGQPLHTFDFGKLAGPEIRVRRASKEEKFIAIDHRTYTLDERMCVIADAEKVVALAGVMGGADTEVSMATTDILIESADFDPLTVRTAARKLNLHSPSSYRFERGVDPIGVDWASRRCAELVLDLAGGELAEGVIEAGEGRAQNEPVVLRLSQLERILGIKIDAAEVRRILTALGCNETAYDVAQVTTVPPSWRRDLPREIDLVEEVARIHGYDKIPEDVGVPMVPSYRSDEDRVLEKVRQVLFASGFDEAMTVSVVSEEWSAAFSPWSKNDPIISSTPMLRGADRLRRSLVPSLLGVRKVNESLANDSVDIFEIAKVYLPGDGELPTEEKMLCVTTGEDFSHLKGALEGLIESLNRSLRLKVEPTSHDLLDPVRSCCLKIDGQLCGYLGEVTPAGLKRFGLRGSATIAELRVDLLCSLAQLISKYQPQSAFPAVTRDINLIADDSVRWVDIEATARENGGGLLEQAEFKEIYRDIDKDGVGKKRLLFTLTFRSSDRTLTSEEVDTIRDTIVTASSAAHETALLA